MEDRAIQVRSSMSLSGLGFVVGLILTILEFAGAIHIGWFWATFAFWIVPAVAVVIGIIILIILMWQMCEN